MPAACSLPLAIPNLTPDDLRSIALYQSVSDQCSAHAGEKKGEVHYGPLRLEAVRAHLEIEGVPRREWRRRTEDVRLLHALKHSHLDGSALELMLDEGEDGSDG